MKKKLHKIEWFREPKGLNENYQQTGMLFAFVGAPTEDKAYPMCHEWVKCRDYLHDAVRTELTGKESEVYGFKFSKGVNPSIDLKKMRMLVAKDILNLKDEKTETAEFRKKIEYSLTLLRHFEKLAGVTLSRVMEVDLPESAKKRAVVMFSSSPMWLKSPSMVSLYSFIIRLGDKKIDFKDEEDLKAKFKSMAEDYKSSKSSDNDLNYLLNMHEKIHTIVKNRTELFKMEKGFHDIYFMDNSISYFHNNCGILSLCLSRTPDVNLNNAVTKLLSKKEEK